MTCPTQTVLSDDGNLRIPVGHYRSGDILRDSVLAHTKPDSQIPCLENAFLVIAFYDRDTMQIIGGEGVCGCGERLRI